jgi:hypothetical protein
MTVDENKRKVEAALELVRAVAEMIREVGRIPSGELYALLMGKMTLDTYEKMIRMMINQGLIREERSHMLVWTGPGGAK